MCVFDVKTLIHVLVNAPDTHKDGPVCNMYHVQSVVRKKNILVGFLLSFRSQLLYLSVFERTAILLSLALQYLASTTMRICLYVMS